MRRASPRGRPRCRKNTTTRKKALVDLIPAVKLGPVLLRESHVGEHVRFGIVEDGGAVAKILPWTDQCTDRTYDFHCAGVQRGGRRIFRDWSSVMSQQGRLVTATLDLDPKIRSTREPCYYGRRSA